MMAENITSIVELAKANNIRVVLCSLTRSMITTPNNVAQSFGKIIGINGWLKEYAARSGSVYLDYYSAMTEGRNSEEGIERRWVPPNDAGYAVMAPLAEAAIAQAVS